MNTNFQSLKGLDNTPFKEYFYFHRIKATLNISGKSSLNKWKEKLQGLVGPKFMISCCNIKYTDFKGTHSSPLEVKIFDSKNTLRHWAYINCEKNQIYIDSRYPLKRIEQFIDFLKKNGVELFINHTTYSYVEICCRYPFYKFQDATILLDKIAKRFNTGKADIKIEKLASGKEYSHLIKKLFIDGYFNIKTYKLLADFNTANQVINEHIEPKLEIQIYKPASLEEAGNRGVTILKSIISSLEIPTIPMNKDNEIDDYTYIPESNKIGQNEKVISCLMNKELKTLPNLPDYIVKHNRSLSLVNAIWFEGKKTNSICNWLNISDSTFRRTVKRLGKVIEKRGDRKTGYLYGIDTTELDNKYQLSNVTKLRSKNILVSNTTVSKISCRVSNKKISIP